MRAVVSLEQLGALASQVPREAPRPERRAGSPGEPFDLEQWLSEHGLQTRPAREWKGGRLYVFDVCPWNEAHTDRSAYVIQHASGALDAGCHHNGCQGKDWAALRELVEPGYRERPSRNGRSPVAPAAAAAAEEPLNSFFSLNSYQPQAASQNSFLSLDSSPGPGAPGPLNSSLSLNSFSTPALDEADADWPADLAPEAFHGIAGEIVRALAPETEADPAALLLNLLVLFGNAVGRGPYVEVLTTSHHCNFFAALVGTTGEGSKGTSWDPIQWLFRRAIPTYVQSQVVSGLASGEGLISLVRDRREKEVQVKDKKSGRLTAEREVQIEDEGVDDKRCLVVEEEMSALLKIMNRPGNVLSEHLRQAWARGDLQNLSKGAPMRATGAHISVLGHITPDALRLHLTAADAANGFANRFLWMLSRRSQYLPEGGTLPYLNTYITYIRELVELASGKIMAVAREASTQRMWAAVYKDLRQPGVGMFGELTARRAPMVARLSLIYALLDGVSVVLPEHLLAALAVWQRSEACVRFLFGDATGDPTADQLYEAIAQRPEGAARTDLHAALGRNRPVAELDRGLTALRRAGRATMQRQKGEGGREMEAWYALPVRGATEAGCDYLGKARAAYESNEFNESSSERGLAEGDGWPG